MRGARSGLAGIRDPQADGEVLENTENLIDSEALVEDEIIMDEGEPESDGTESEE